MLNIHFIYFIPNDKVIIAHSPRFLTNSRFQPVVLNSDALPIAFKFVFHQGFQTPRNDKNTALSSLRTIA